MRTPALIAPSIVPLGTAPSLSMSLAAPVLAPVAAGQLLLPEIAACGAVYWLSSAYARQRRVPVEPLDGAVWEECRVKNNKRFEPRVVVKVLAAAMVFLGVGRGAAMPSMAHQAAFGIWLGAMGLLDEVGDMPKALADGAARFPKILHVIASACLVLPIPYLLAAHEVYSQYTFHFFTSHFLAGKVDIPVFKIASAVGVVLLLIAGLATGITPVLETLSAWPLVGMGCVMTGKALWELRDEDPRLIAFCERWNVPELFWELINQHTLPLLLVAVGLLPAPWLAMMSSAYPVAKIGLAQGMLSWAFGAKPTPAPATPETSTNVASFSMRSPLARVRMWLRR